MANASLFPAAKGAAFMRFAGNTYQSLASELRKRGYATIALHGDRPGFWNRSHMYPALGFDHFISKREFAPAEGIGLGMSDGAFFKQSLEHITELRDGGKPFYALLVTLTSHHPFNFKAIRERVTDLPLGGLEGTLLGDYLTAIRYADACIGAFIEGIAEKGLLDESVIVLYGDHPAIPKKNGAMLGKLLGRDMSSAVSWRGAQSVPLMIRLPMAEGADIYDTPSGQMDIAPTVASLMGFHMPMAFGENLLDKSTRRSEKMVIFRNGSYIIGDAWILPGEDKAFDLTNFERIKDFDSFKEATAEAARRIRAVLEDL
jgi:phosphoglycerol transferase MdoB-like AlkP superfamily enzyme